MEKNENNLIELREFTGSEEIMPGELHGVFWHSFSPKEWEMVNEWYDTTQDTKWDYVVFLARRSYVLAELVARSRGKTMEENNITVYLTDAALLLRIDEIVDIYKITGVFPRILLCDDILIHGRSINHFLSIFEEEIVKRLEDYDEEQIREMLVFRTTVYTCMKSNEPLFLLNRYRANFHCVKKVKPQEWRSMSNSITNFISDNNIVYAAYIYSLYLPSVDVLKKQTKLEWSFEETVYQNRMEYTMVDFVQHNHLIKAILTLRLKENDFTGDYRAVPFVFLPKLNEDTTRLILKEIKERARGDGQITKWLEDWSKSELFRRNLDELITLIFSCVILNAFIKEYDVEENTKMAEAEIKKLARNYNYGKLSDTEKILRKIVNAELFEYEELKEFLEKIIPRSASLFTKEAENNGKEIFKTEERMKEELNKYFYEMAYKDEITALQTFSMRYISRNDVIRRRAKDCGRFFRIVFSGQATAICQAGIRYLLQMMDAGVVAVSSYPPRNAKPYGFCQYAKNGEQSLLLKTLELYEYIPMLNQLWQNCIPRNWDVIDELKRFYESEFWEEERNPEKLGKLEDYLNDLLDLSQEPEDWLGNFFTRASVASGQENPIGMRWLVMTEKRLRLNDGYYKFLRARNL